MGWAQLAKPGGPGPGIRAAAVNPRFNRRGRDSGGPFEAHHSVMIPLINPMVLRHKWPIRAITVA